MILSIDTSDQRLVKVSLKGDKTLESLEENNQFGSQILLSLIKKLLDKRSLKTELSNSVYKQSIGLKDLKGIEVNTGPGSFTGLRVGVATANALGFSLGIPVNGKETETELKYQ